MSTPTPLEVVKIMGANGILGKWDIVRQYVADDMVMHVPAGLPYGGDYVGWDGYLRCFKEMGAFYTGLKSAEQKFAAEGNKVIVMTEMSGTITKTGRPVTIPLTTVWEVKDGKVIHITPFYYDTKAICDLAGV